MSHAISYQYLPVDGERFFTVVLLPYSGGKFPTVVCRSPYVSHAKDKTEEETAQEYYESVKPWLDRGYAVAFQHCRGKGKSSGGFTPYLFEREDGLAFRSWIREQDFYNGELFLLGSSYTASLHYATAPFEKDIQGAVFEVQDPERYRLWYRNGQMRKGHANWHFGLYQSKSGVTKNFSMQSFAELPLQGLSEKALGERAEDFERTLFAPTIDDGFWNTRLGGAETRTAVTQAEIPILLTTGYNDFYVGGVMETWKNMRPKTKEKSALLLSPYNHGDGYSKENGLAFPLGARKEAFGKDYQIAWFDHIRTGSHLPFQKGVITYFRAFEKGWATDFYQTPTNPVSVPLGNGDRPFCYDPKNPPKFLEEGRFAENFDGRNDVVTLYTRPFEKDAFVKGKMQAVFSVRSDRPDTSFYVRISLEKSEYAYVLRHDITSLCHQLGSYKENTVVPLEFTFDEYAFLIQKGERLRVDISATDDNTYVSHTNQKGEYPVQTQTEIARNTVFVEQSYLILPVE